MKNPSNLHLMQDAEQRRSMIDTYYKQGLRRGLWYGFFVSLIVTGAIWAIVYQLLLRS